MSTITIFGTGNMGSAIDGVLTQGGATVEHLNTSSSGRAVTGDIVILAVPYPALRGIAAEYGDQLAGRIVVDITNPVNFETFDSLVVPPGSSAAAELAELLPASRVVKAFNTNFAATLAAGTVGPTRTTVLMAGDDAEAKAALAAAVTAGGTVDALDAGALVRAHELEAFGFLQMTLAAAEKLAWSAGFGVVR
jgi:predicted dinucleotide-binding enzyme